MNTIAGQLTASRLPLESIKFLHELSQNYFFWREKTIFLLRKRDFIYKTMTCNNRLAGSHEYIQRTHRPTHNEKQVQIPTHTKD